jgi:WD40 repeat protein
VTDVLQRIFLSGSRDCTVKVWSSEQGIELAELRGHNGTILACEYSPNGRFIASASEDHSIKIFDANSYQECHTLRYCIFIFAVNSHVIFFRGHTDEVIAIAFLGNRYLVSGLILL